MGKHIDLDLILRNIKCMIGLHKYNKEKSKSNLIRERENGYDLCVEDVCENCGKVRIRIVVAK